MDQRWLILADDLTGAADSAIAFARRGASARVLWGDARPEAHSDARVLAYDVATRECGPEDAARGHAEALRRFLVPRMRVFKKIDSTLRGHPAGEIAAMLGVLRAQEPAIRVVLAPSFPAMGRTVRDGNVCVHGVRLPMTEYWPAGRAPALANLVNLLASAGVPAHHVPLASVRDSDAQRSPHPRVEVFDAETDEDLERIANAGLAAGGPTLFIGSAGLAHALAHAVSRFTERRAELRTTTSPCGALIVVGSRARASRAALAQLLTLADVESVSVDPLLLGADAQPPAMSALAQSIAASLARGADVVVDIAQQGDAKSAGNPRLVAVLARLLAPAARQASALVATGGETAAALLNSLGVEGLRLVDEIEPGIPLGFTLGGLSILAVTKAGGFGDEESLKRIISRLRTIRHAGVLA